VAGETAEGRDPATATDPPGAQDRPAGRARSWLTGRPPGGLPGRLVSWSPYLMAAFFAALYGVFALSRHHRLQTAGYDLGIFTQAVKAYAHFSAPIVEIKEYPDFNLLGDHFHPILMLLGPVYRVFPSATTLLLAQAVLIAVSVIPVGRLAVARLGPAGGVSVMAAYGLSWGIQGAIGFDFHEIAFAVPLLAFALAALAEERWVAAAGWTLPLLTVKEDLGATVAAVGLYLLFRRRWRLGGLVLGAGVAVSALVVFVIVPALSPFGTFRYWNTYGGGDPTAGPGQVDLVRLLLELPANLVSPEQKVHTLLLLVAVTAGAALFSPLVLIAVPTLLWRFSSSYEPFWDSGTVHYNAVLMPVMFVAFVDGVGRLRRSRRAALRGYARLAVPAVLVIALAIVPRFSFGDFLDGDVWRSNPRAAATHQMLGLVPDGARVSVSNYLIPQIVDRCEVLVFPRHLAPGRDVDWIVVDSRTFGGVPHPTELQGQEFGRLVRGETPFRQVAERDGVHVFARR
jgi:uncharacterized membrane protein